VRRAGRGKQCRCRQAAWTMPYEPADRPSMTKSWEGEAQQCCCSGEPPRQIATLPPPLLFMVLHAIPSSGLSDGPSWTKRPKRVVTSDGQNSFGTKETAPLSGQHSLRFTFASLSRPHRARAPCFAHSRL
jgi:hypothetical protein